MLKLLKSPSQILTVDTRGMNVKRGLEMNNVGLLENYSIVIENDTIKDFLSGDNFRKYEFDEIIDLKNKVVLPGLIDCHTHTAFAGSRANEFRMKISGVGYEEIANAGGGIARTVEAIRKYSEQELVALLRPRIEYFICQGVTTLEIKSGYGLSFADEIKLLKVINHLKTIFAIDIVPTFLGAHTVPAEFKTARQSYINMITEELIPYVSKNHLAEFCDVFCETTAFSKPETDAILQKASAAGMKIKLHSEQFNNIGGLDLALKYNAVSIDHLEMIKKEDIGKIAHSETVCVLLPGVSFFLHYDYAPARELINGNAAVAISTDYNPGSSNIANLNLIMSLAAIEMRMTIEETISAVTVNAAKALSVHEGKGSLEIGKKADLAVFDTTEYPDIVYQVGKNLNIMTFKNGNLIYKN